VLLVSQTELERGVGEVLIDEDRLQERIRELGREISSDYAGRELLLVGVLKGAVFFMADLMRSLSVRCEIDFMAISSYGAATDSPAARGRSRTCSSTRRSRAPTAKVGRSSCAATKSSRCQGSCRTARSRSPVSQTEVEQGVGEVLIEEDALQARIRELGREISADYADRELLLVGVLKGAVFFMADLMRSLTVPCEIDFMAISSYGAATDSSGVVRILKDLDINIDGRDVLVVEDIIDSGLTLSYLMRNLESREPASLEICALLTKPERREIHVPVRSGSRSPTGS